jgi:hypothetical protein
MEMPDEKDVKMVKDVKDVLSAYVEEAEKDGKGGVHVSASLMTVCGMIVDAISQATKRSPEEICKVIGESIEQTRGGGLGWKAN